MRAQLRMECRDVKSPCDIRPPIDDSGKLDLPVPWAKGLGDLRLRVE